MTRLRQRLGYHTSYTARPRRPKSCTICGCVGHNAARCEIDERMRVLTGDEYWRFKTYEGPLPVPSNVGPLHGRTA